MTGIEERGEHITSLSDMLSVLGESYFTKRFGLWIFRGVSKYSYDLKPKVGRNVPKGMTVYDYEKSLLDIFQRDSRPYLRAEIRNDYEWLSLAQHHGLPTRMLDWTFNPLVALYFATRSHQKTDGALIALHAEKKLSPKRMKEGKPFELSKPYKVLPDVVTNRIQNQQGLFVIFNEPDKSLENCLSSQEEWKIVKWSIPAKHKKKIKYDLFRTGFDEARMFPSLDGLASHLEWRLSASAIDNQLSLDT